MRALTILDAVKQIEGEGDVPEPVNHASLGNSLHRVGFGHSSQGRYEEALPF